MADSFEIRTDADTIRSLQQHSAAATSARCDALCCAVAKQSVEFGYDRTIALLRGSVLGTCTAGLVWVQPSCSKGAEFPW